MVETGWKVVMDRDGVTISSDLFQLTTNGSEPAALETVVSELQSVTRGTYGQYCGLSRAAEMIGERWGMLVLRDLLESPKTLAQLHRGLPLLSLKLLTMRLDEMEYSGVIRKQDYDAPESSEAVYELTEYGRALEDTLLALGRWGAIVLGEPRPEDIVTEDSLMVGLRATFVAEAAADIKASFELRVGEVVIHAIVDHGTLTLGPGSLPGVDVVINPGTVLKAVISREITIADALASGRLKVNGDLTVLPTFAKVFYLPALPAPDTAR
jgi:DNA-binding HxlR family transcriptional regulator